MVDHNPPAGAEPLLSTKQAAAVLGFHASYLAKARLTGAGPRYLKIGGRSVRYRRSDIDAWLAEKARASTSDPAWS
jgi:predicted DNA-binding transcriptional regulator AlpA